MTGGVVAPGWEQVRDTFEANFANGLELGSAFAVYHRGRKVVDLWGGIANDATARPWDDRTIVPVFSTTKGATAICANLLAQRGELDVDAPVASYWPEFAVAGKERIPVSQLLSHQAGLAWIDGPMTAEEALAWDPVTEALAAQAPSWEPGSSHGYHAVTFGWLVGEVVRRITGVSLGTFFRREVAEPLGLDFWIGLPEREEPRVARLERLRIPGMSAEQAEQVRRRSVGELVASFMGPDAPLARSLDAPGGAFGDVDIWNSRAMHAAEVPSANGIADARSLARMYAACIGEVDGTRLLGEEQLARATTRHTSGPNTILFDLDIQFGLGFMVRTDLVALGGPRAFGHFGFGGSFGWADPDAELAMGYVMNRLEIGLAGDLRGVALIGAAFDAARAA